MTYIGFARPSRCASFWAWLYWYCDERDGSFERVLGFEFKYPYKETSR